MKFALTLVAILFCASALAFKPTRTIEVVVHTGPGGGSDILARAVAGMIEKEKLAPVRSHIDDLRPAVDNSLKGTSAWINLLKAGGRVEP